MRADCAFEGAALRRRTGRGISPWVARFARRVAACAFCPNPLDACRARGAFCNRAFGRRFRCGASAGRRRMRGAFFASRHWPEVPMRRIGRPPADAGRVLQSRLWPEVPMRRVGRPPAVQGAFFASRHWLRVPMRRTGRPPADAGRDFHIAPLAGGSDAACRQAAGGRGARFAIAPLARGSDAAHRQTVGGRKTDKENGAHRSAERAMI